MELVKFKKNGGLVTINIVINGLVAWRYVYVTDTHNYVKTSSDPAPCIHVLGFPDTLEGDVNSWDIQLANVSDSDQDYKIEVAWEQNGAVLKTWLDSGNIASDTAKVVSANAWLIGVV